MKDRGQSRNDDKRIRGVRSLAAFLALLLIVQMLPSFSHRAQADSQTGAFAYTALELEGLAYINEIRAKVGVKPLQLDKSLTLAARSHAAYSNANVDERKTDPHGEKEGHQGFTGRTVRERMEHFGGEFPYGFGEVMHYQQSDVKSAIDGWLNTAYHRTIILGLHYDSIGFGLVDGTAVADLGITQNPAVTDAAIVYPYDGMTNAAIGFYGNERPNPLRQFDVEYSGEIISLTTSSNIVFHGAKIVDEFGKNVEYYTEKRPYRDLYLYPKEVLEGYTTYTVSITYSTQNQPEERTKTWSFRTGKGRETKGFSAQQHDIVVNVGSPLQLVLTENYTDGTTSPLRSKVTYYSASPSGFKVSQEGVLEGIKPGEYVVKFMSGQTFELANVIVYDKLKTKKYPAVQSSKVKDVSMHPKREVIEWALASGIASGDKDGNFRPDELITEAEFWTMMLKMYNIDYEAYAPKKKQHWSDGAYKIAKDRSIPLMGLSKSEWKNNTVYRNQVMTMLPAMDGVNIEYNNVQAYVVAKNFMRGITGTADMSLNDRVTRADALQILKDLKPNLKELKGKPSSVTPDRFLPKEPIYEVYTKPMLEDRMVFVEFDVDGSLTLEGKFSEYVGQEVTVQVEQREAPKLLLDKVTVQQDAGGNFSATFQIPDDVQGLNVFFGPSSMLYFINVEKGKMNATQYPQY